MDKNKMIIIGIIAAAVLGGVLYMNVSNTPQPQPTPTPESQVKIDISPATEVMEEKEGTEDGTMMKGKMMNVMMEGKPFSFSQKEIRVKKGDKVKIQFKNMEGFHDWVIDEFNARTKQLPAGQSEIIEFIADKTGTFEYYCSVGQHRANGMVGKLIVE